MNTLLDKINGGAGWRQTDRLLTLTTPLGPDILLAETVRIDEALGPILDHAGYRIELTALSTDAHLPLTALLGQSARLDLQTAASRTLLRPFHGHITRITREGSGAPQEVPLGGAPQEVPLGHGFTRYRLIIEPWLAFLGHNQDNYLFQDKSVIDIVDELLGDWKHQGKLAPDWQWRLADPSVYPKRGITTQYRESDLAFLKRLLAEEGLFCWFEHTREEGDTLGKHTLIIADANTAFTANTQPRIRYTQSGATLAEDSLDRWHGRRQLDTQDLHAASWDYRSLSTRPQSAISLIDNGQTLRTAAWHDPGQYAWQNAAHGQRMLDNQRQAIDARLKQYNGQGTVRSAAPGTTFFLADHAEHDRDPLEQRRFLITAVTHQARNNLAGITHPGTYYEGQGSPTVDHYRNTLTAIRAGIPWKPLMADSHAPQEVPLRGGRAIPPRPTAHGTLTAIVIGEGGRTHTDRDGRIRVQFPWQRGSDAGARHEHPSGSDNAPADARLGIWLRVMTPVAGANWGGHLLPRPGQEVLVAFHNGNIDRPLVIGTAYNGQGNPDAPGNRIGGGTQQSSANAPAFFTGEKDSAHTHHASLSGLKTQQLATCKSGQGGHNQLVFDDTPGQSRIELGTTQYRSSLQLGHLKQQSDNARQADRGHGGELQTQASLALRAGSGLLLSADVRPNASGPHLDSREAIAQTQEANNLSRSLAEVAHKQNAGLEGDPQAYKLPAIESLKQAEATLGATATHGARHPAGQGEGIKATQGGTGSVPAWSQPRLQIAAPAGIAQLTPADHLLVAGQNLAIATGHDTNLIAQGHHSLAVKNGLALFAVGKANNKQKPNQETGIHLHAASGAVSLQSQGGKTTAAADKKVSIASSTGKLTASAKQKILATAQGAYLKIEGGNIELHAPGKVEFKASMKKWMGPKMAGVELPSSIAASELNLPLANAPGKTDYSQRLNVAGLIGGDPQSGALYANLPYEAYNEQGQKIAAGQLSADGTTGAIHTQQPEKVKVVISQGDWLFFQDVNHL